MFLPVMFVGMGFPGLQKPDASVMRALAVMPGTSPTVMTALSMLRLLNFLTVHPTLEAALAAVPAGPRPEAAPAAPSPESAPNPPGAGQWTVVKGVRRFDAATAPDGQMIDAWLLRPADAGPGPGPTLLSIHGGPFTQYGNRFVDDFQIQAAAGSILGGLAV